MLSLGDREFLTSLFNSSLDELPDGLNVRNIMRNMGTFRELARKVVLLASSQPDAYELHKHVKPFLDMPLKDREVAATEQPTVDEVGHGLSCEGFFSDGSTRT